MDEKMKEALKGIYENLTEEQKEKAKACKSMDELMTLAGEWGVELPDEMLDAVGGGVGIVWETVELDPVEQIKPTPTPAIGPATCSDDDDYDSVCVNLWW